MRSTTSRCHSLFIHVAPWLCAILIAISASITRASVFYKLTVAQDATATGLTGFGPAPSINEKGKVAYVTKSSAGDSLSVWLPGGAGAFDISPSFRSPQRTFGDSALINNRDEVVAWSRSGTAGNFLSEVRVFRSRQPDDSTVVAHAKSGLFRYDTLFQYPTIDNSLALKDQFVGANVNGLCDDLGGAGCYSRVAFGAFIASPLQRFLSMAQFNPISSSQNNPSNGTYNEYSLVSTAVRPQMTDDGRVVVRGNLPTSPIQLLNYNLPQSTVNVVSTADGFVSLGVAPGVTPDGKIVAFAGSRGSGGDGVFLSIYDATLNARRIVRVVGENTVVRKPELGYDEQANPIYFQSIQVDSRVGIIYTPDAKGVANGSVVISFIGTPSAPSRTNLGTGKPFTFSDQPGLFTVRIDLNERRYRDRFGNTVCVAKIRRTSILPFTKGDDVVIAPSNFKDDEHSGFIAPGPNGICESSDNDDSEALSTRSSPIPVVQLGDTVYAGSTPHVIMALSVNGPLAPANFDDNFAARQARSGDHRVAFWAQTATTQLIVTGEHLDSDLDGLMDHWEKNGISLDGNGVVDLDLPGMGANPLKRDLFMQWDWINERIEGPNSISYEPIPTVVDSVVKYFASAPAMLNGVQSGITVHIDGGIGFDKTGVAFSRNMNSAQLRGGNNIGGTVDVLYLGRPGSVAIPNMSVQALDQLKNSRIWFFERGAREFAFRYVVFANAYEGFPNSDNAIRGQVTGGVTSECFEDAGNPNFDTNFASRGVGVLITAGAGAGQVRAVNRTNDGGQRRLCIEPEVPWTVLPNLTSQYGLLSSSSGVGAAPTRFDMSFAPGRNVIISLGTFLRSPVIGFTNSFFTSNGLQQAETVVHELGHIFGLPHGGTNHINFKPEYGSVMNYAYQGCETGVGSFENGTPFPNGFACPLYDYGSGTNPLYDFHDDWSDLDLRASTNLQSLGNAFGRDPTLASSDVATDSELNVSAIKRRFGAPDVVRPSIDVLAPTVNSSVVLGNAIPVSLSASDNRSVAAAYVYFDVNGDSTIDINTERFAAVRGSGSSWTATVPAVSGPAGQRMLVAIAEDISLNSDVERVPLDVGSVAMVAVPNVVGLTQSAATNAIVAAGLTVGTITQQNSATVPAGNVISQNPAAGINIAPNSSVSLVVSRGPAPVAGDVNNDGVVNCADIAIVRASFGRRNGQTGFDARADLNRDGVVNVIDLSTVARQLSAGTTCN